MDYKAKNKQLYKGFLFECFILIVVPLVLYIFFRSVLAYVNPESVYLNKVSAKAMGFGLGTVVHVYLWIAGVFDEAWCGVKRRVGNFFANLKISFKVAVHEYIFDLRAESLEFWAYFIIIAVCALLAADGILEYVTVKGLFE